MKLLIERDVHWFFFHLFTSMINRLYDLGYRLGYMT